MSHNYDPNHPDQAAEPPRPPRGHHARLLIVTGAVALAAGATVGGLIGSMNSTPSGTATATSRSVLSASQIAARMDPGLADVVSTDGDQDATSAGTGIVLTSDGLVLTNNHVIEGTTSIKVTDIGNGRTYTAEVVGCGQPVSTAEDIAKALVPHHPGSSISISWVDQYGQSHTATVVLANGPAA